MGIKALGIGNRNPSPTNGFFQGFQIFQMGNEPDSDSFVICNRSFMLPSPSNQ